LIFYGLFENNLLGTRKQQSKKQENNKVKSSQQNKKTTYRKVESAQQAKAKALTCLCLFVSMFFK
jgi:hypothetical protein